LEDLDKLNVVDPHDGGEWVDITSFGNTMKVALYTGRQPIQVTNGSFTVEVTENPDFVYGYASFEPKTQLKIIEQLDIPDLDLD
jgi:hypothetical protein